MMKHSTQAILFVGMIFSSLIGADYNSNNCIEFSRREVFIPEKLGNARLYKDSDGFHILKDNEIYDVQNCFCDPLLRKMSDAQLVNFLGRNKPKIIFVNLEDLQINPDDIVEVTESEKEILLNQLFGSGYVSVNQMNDGEYILRAKIRLPGGVWGIRVGTLSGAIIGGILGGSRGKTGVIGGGVAGGAVGAGVGFSGEKIGEGLGSKIGELNSEEAARRGEEYGREAGGVGAVVGAVVFGGAGAVFLGRYGAAGGIALGTGVGGAVGGAAGGVVAIIVGDEKNDQSTHDEENPKSHCFATERESTEDNRETPMDNYYPRLTELFCGAC